MKLNLYIYILNIIILYFNNFNYIIFMNQFIINLFFQYRNLYIKNSYFHFLTEIYIKKNYFILLIILNFHNYYLNQKYF